MNFSIFQQGAKLPGNSHFDQIRGNFGFALSPKLLDCYASLAVFIQLKIFYSPVKTRTVNPQYLRCPADIITSGLYI